MRISDWSSDVCSSDLPCGAGNAPPRVGRRLAAAAPGVRVHLGFSFSVPRSDRHPQPQSPPEYAICAHPQTAQAKFGGRDRKSVEEGKSVSVLVELGGRGILKKKSSQSHIKINNKEQKLRITQ